MDGLWAAYTKALPKKEYITYTTMEILSLGKEEAYPRKPAYIYLSEILLYIYRCYAVFSHTLMFMRV